MQQIQIGDIIDNQYEIKRQLSQGSFGKVYFGSCIKTNKKVAIKVEKQEMASYHSLDREVDILRKLKGVSQIPELYWFGVFKGCNVMIVKMLGHDLIHFHKKYKQFSVGCVFSIGYQMIGILEQIHKKNIIHRDLKPENILSKNESDKIYLIDFGISKEIEFLKFNKKDKLSFIGTSRYASLAAHQGLEQSKKDDLESLGYILIFLLQFSLPWMIVEKQDQSRLIKIGQIKENIPLLDLCEGCPQQIYKYMKYVRELSPHSKPRYAMMRGLFLSTMHNEVSMDLDWFKVKDKASKNKKQEKRMSCEKSNFRSCYQIPKPLQESNTTKHLRTIGMQDDLAGSSDVASNTSQFSVNETFGSNPSVRVGFTFSDFHDKLKVNHSPQARISTFEGLLDSDPIISLKSEQQLMENENQDLEIKYNLLHFRSVYFNFKNPIQHFALRTHCKIKLTK